jgi:phage FluMu gp28-like protein
VTISPLKTDLESKGRTDTPAALLKYQQDWIADTSELKIAEKSRRIGLTWAESADNVLIASSEGGSNVFYISATQDMAIEYIEACAMWAKHFDMAASEIEEGIFVGACKNFCVNGHLAGNCRAPRSDDGRSKESSTEGVAGQPAG